MNRRLGEFIEIVPAQQRICEGRYVGTADAVFQNLDLVRRAGAAHVLVLGGDHVYKMDFTALLADHAASNADVTVACVEVPLRDAAAFGVMEVDRHGRITGWVEKPQLPKPVPGSTDRALASMGIYAFGTAALVHALCLDARDRASSRDFGHDVLPAMIGSGMRVQAHSFSRSCVRRQGAAPYWRDVGTLDAYWEANLDLVRSPPPCDIFDRGWPIPATADLSLPSQFRSDGRGHRPVIEESLAGSGCVIGAASIVRSVLFSDVSVRHGARLEETLVLPEAEVGRGVQLKRAIVDKYCKLPAGLVVGHDPARDRHRFHVTAGGVTLVTPEMLGQRSAAPAEDFQAAAGAAPSPDAGHRQAA
jgi:glucose-1-phosphate adenylyltransferase